ncbi:unnamed protein product, partial [Laminaria digitata]
VAGGTSTASPSPSAKRATRADGTHRLQLASLQLCILCRSRPTLRLRVDHDTPTRLWAADDVNTDASQTTAAKRPCSTRVPPP